MTERQESLKKEIVRISDIIQLGIREDDRDWFYMFIGRADGKWKQICKMDFISIDFYNEFEKNLDLHTMIVCGNKNIPLLQIIETITTNYLCGSSYYIVMEISKDEKLTDDLVLKYEKLFDQTYGRFGWNAVPCIKETAWFYILQNKSISEDVKNKFSKKPLSN